MKSNEDQIMNFNIKNNSEVQCKLNYRINLQALGYNLADREPVKDSQNHEFNP